MNHVSRECNWISVKETTLDVMSILSARFIINLPHYISPENLWPKSSNHCGMAILESCCWWRSVRRGSFASVLYTFVSQRLYMYMSKFRRIISDSEIRSFHNGQKYAFGCLEQNNTPLKFTFNIIHLKQKPQYIKLLWFWTFVLWPNVNELISLFVSLFVKFKQLKLTFTGFISNFL